MVEDPRAFEPTESTEDAERLFIEDFDTWDMTGYYLYSKLLRSGVSRHIGTGGLRIAASGIRLVIRPGWEGIDNVSPIRVAMTR
jgi:hypothetical protein